MDGWIKLHRKFLKWEWYQKNGMVRLFIYLLLHANHGKKKWEGIIVDRGQIITGRKKLSKNTGLSEQAIRTCLTRLKSTSEITIRSTSKYSIITICNYEEYQRDDRKINQQNNQDINQQSTSNQPAINQQSTTNKKEKNVKKEKNIKKQVLKHPLPTGYKLEQEHIKYFKSKNTPGDINDIFEGFCIYHKKNGNKYTDWYAAWQTWVRNHIKFEKEKNIVCETYEDIQSARLFKNPTG